MELKGMTRERCARRLGQGVLLASFLAFAIPGWGQSGGASGERAPLAAVTGADLLPQWEGLPVRRIAFEGVAAGRLTPLAGHLAQAEGATLDREKLKRSLHQLFATGLYENIEVEGAREEDGVVLTFSGAARTFIGRVTVEGAKGASMNTQLESASQLAAGTRFTTAKLARAEGLMRQTLAQNGFNAPSVSYTLTSHDADQLMDVAFHISSGPQARVGGVEVTGDAGMSEERFRRYAHLKAGEHVDHETGSRALAGILKKYQKEQRLEAEIKLESQEYDAATGKTNYRFSANRGPVVEVRVEGASTSMERLKKVIPVFEEGTVDDDLLNEGNRRLRDFYQRLGYFDVKVDHEEHAPGAGQVVIMYQVELGARRRVERVDVAGNHYFDAATLREQLSVHVADSTDRHGAYSQALLAADVSALQALYQNNGFSKVKITPESNAGKSDSKHPAPLLVVYRIEEGGQQRVGSLRLEGNAHVETNKLTGLMNTAAGQLLSPRSLAEDRDALWTDYLSRGFDQAKVEVTQQLESGNPSKVDVVFHISEGQQIFVRKVLITGLHYTRPDAVAKAITLHPGDPLNQTALLETQRNLYDFALFNQVDTAIENPAGGETEKTVLIQTTEARRWALTYGFGFEAQTGTPQNNCESAIAGGVPCNPEGKTGASYRLLLDITRNNLFGREQSVSLRGTYGLLEQNVNLLFQNPHFEGNRNFGLTLSGGYASSLDVSTYVASKLEGGMRWTEHFNTPGTWISKANTLVYEFDFRRVKVQASSLLVDPKAISQLATAVRVAGPAITWIRDTRDSPLDAHQGTYTSFQDFFSGLRFGAQTNFNRLDVSNSSYWSFGKGRYVLARNTRYGQERAFGTGNDELIPLPERLYAGGPTSLRGFGSNSAGPRDPETGYPIGGAGALVESTELRLPPPTLPWLGNTVSLVLFHDMGNVFTNAQDAWVSAIRVRQPNLSECKTLAVNYPGDFTPKGSNTSTGKQGLCSFNYFSHAPGLGMRYHTPVGPIRLDFSYNLNPPIYPVNTDYSLKTTVPNVPAYDTNPHVGEGGHFNFFFSLGQTF
jgi:outer membrane protein insertion porin family